MLLLLRVNHLFNSFHFVHVLPTDRQTPPAGRVAPIPRWIRPAPATAQFLGVQTSAKKAINDDPSTSRSATPACAAEKKGTTVLQT